MMKLYNSLRIFLFGAVFLCMLIGTSGAVAAVVQSDMGTGGDAGDSFGDATLVSAGTGTGYFYVQTDPYETDVHDFYKIYVGVDQLISASVTPVEDTSTWYHYLDVDLNLYEPSGTLVKYSALGGEQTDSVSYTASSYYGYYVIEVVYTPGIPPLDKSGYYEMTVSVGGQNDMNSGDDAGDSFATATSISTATGTGYLDDMDYEDYYKVSSSSGQTINVDMTPPTGADFDLYLANTYQIDLFDAQSTNPSDAAESVSYTVSSAGDYYIRVELGDDAGSGTYSMTVTVTGGGLSGENIQASTGGTVETGDAKVEIPANALAQDTVITMVETTATAPSGYAAVSSVYEVGPSGTTFNISATITLPYDESTIPAGVSEENLAIYRQGSGGWEKLGGTVDTSANTVSVQVDHLSNYAVMAPSAGEELPLLLIMIILVVVIVIVVILLVVGLAMRRKPGI